MSPLKFLRTSHTIPWPTLRLLVQGTFALIMGISSVALSKKAEGYALGALTLSVCTCLYVNLIERQNERKYHD